MQIVFKDIDIIYPYRNNPRKNDKAVDCVARSIEEFGFKVPIVIDKEGVIVTGHTRIKAAKKLGIAQIPCIIADDLTADQINAFRIADNSVADASKWDYEALRIEIDNIPDFEYQLDDFYIHLPEERDYFGDERERTVKGVNLDLYNPSRIAGRYQMPVIDATQHVPKDLISFNYMLTSKEYDKGIHFYIDDYQFERIWNDPDKYMDKLSQFDCCLTPDFSLYLDMPIAMQIWNVYRSRLIGQIMQDNGIEVIPTLQWSVPESFDFCFDGLKPGGTVSVSTIGVKNSEKSKKIWFDGMEESIKRLDPSNVIVYGGDIGYNFKCKTTYISNHNADNFRRGK